MPAGGPLAVVLTAAVLFAATNVDVPVVFIVIGFYIFYRTGALS
jgi:hypothetical protein